MNTLRLKRNGRDDLIFCGALLYSGQDSPSESMANSRWILELFANESGGYVVCSRLEQRFPERFLFQAAELFPDSGTLRAWFARDGHDRTILGAGLLYVLEQYEDALSHPNFAMPAHTPWPLTNTNPLHAVPAGERI